MELKELKNIILANVNTFDAFLRENFDFYYVDNAVDYNVMDVDEDENDISITLHECGDILNYIFIRLDEDEDDKYKSHEWNGVNLYLFEYLEIAN